jgi:DNA-binding PadR family transcriptional regulator
VAKGGKKNSTPENRALILWALLVKKNARSYQNELKPEPTKNDRETLESKGLVTCGKHGQRIWIEATQKGWIWAEENLTASLPTKSVAGSQILQEWLIRLKAFMGAEEYSLADLLGAQDPPESISEKAAASSRTGYAAVQERVRDAYLQISGGRLNTRVLLRDLRERLKDIDRGELDSALTQMQSDQEASLYQLDNRFEITDADRAAALYFGSEPRHILWIER